MAKPTCDGLVTSLEAIEAHDAAHETESGRLHALALRLMALSGVDHLSIGSDLDVKASPTDAPLLLCGRLDQVPQDLWDGGLYDVCLLRRTDEAAVSAGAVIVGSHVPFAPPLEYGAKKFPLAATPCSGEVTERHVKADGEELPRGVWMVSNEEGGLVVHDCLALGTEQVHRLPLSARLERIPGQFREAAQVVERPSGLCDLPPGRWLLRPLNEPWFDRVHPVGVLYDAQVVRPGQFVRSPRPTRQPPEGETVIQRLPRGMRCQIHKDGSDAWLFVGDHALDCLEWLPPAREIIDRIPADSAVLDGILVADAPLCNLVDDLKRGKLRNKVGVEFVVFDCLYRDGKDLHERPLLERLAAWNVMPPIEGCGVARLADDALPGCLVRPADCEYPLDWDAEGWYRVPEERVVPGLQPTQESHDDEVPGGVAGTDPSGEPADRQLDLSREWFEVCAAEEASAFWESDGDLCLGVPFSERCLRMGQERLDEDRRSASHLESCQKCDCSSSGIAIFGVQRDDMHEVFLHFTGDQERSGRYVWQWSDEEQGWRCWKPKWQHPHLLNCEAESEARDAKKRGGWIAWNASALRLLADSELLHLLPVNWENALEEFEDKPVADFLSV